MKKTVITCIMSVMILHVSGQQDPSYTNWMFNRLAYNPAYAGAAQGVEFSGLKRIQWWEKANDKIFRSGIGDRSGLTPRTMGFTISAPFKKHGIGGSFFNDQVGHEKTLSVNLVYNYKIRLRKGTLALGLSAGMMRKTTDGKFSPIAVGDPNIPLHEQSDTKPDLGLGIYYTNEDFYNLYAGLSCQHVGRQKFEYASTSGTGAAGYVMSRHYYAITGMEFALSHYFKLRPNLLLKSDGATSQVDFNIDLLYDDLLRGGLTYRNEAACALVGVYPSAYLHLGYSFDYTLNKMGDRNRNSHEIFMTYRLVSKQQRAIQSRKPVSSFR